MKTFILSPDAKLSEITLAHNDRLHYTPQHTHNFFEILLVSNGKALHHVNDNTQVIHHKQLQFIRPDDCHYYCDYYDNDFAYYNLHIPRNALYKALSKISMDYSHLINSKLPPLIDLPQIDYLHLTERLDKFETLPLCEEKQLLYDIIIHEVIYLFLTLNVNANSSVPSWFNDLLVEIQKPEIFVEGLKKVLQISGYSQEHVNRSFKKYIDITPTQYINNLRLDYALTLIEAKQYNALNASQCAGFNHYGYFLKLFKNKYGCFPKEFKK